MKNIYLNHDLDLELPGYPEAKMFFESLLTEAISCFKLFYKNQDKSNDYGFDYGEEQVKTFLTIALAKITNINVIQEYQLSRKIINKKKKIDSTYGFLDYWASNNKCDYLIEVKHGWLRYYPEHNRITFYKQVKKRFDAAIKQIRDIESKSQHRVSDHLFGFSFMIAPLFTKQKSNDISPININKELKSKNPPSKKVALNCTHWALNDGKITNSVL